MLLRIASVGLNIATCAAIMGLIASCQSATPRSSSLDRRALPTMERIALAANRCWFKSADPAFSTYKLAPELNSFSGRPRILVVPHSNPENRPLLVVQAEGNPAKLQAFGPLMSDSVSARIATDIKRWANGSAACGA